MRALGTLLLCAAALIASGVAARSPPPTDWRQVMLPTDRERIRNWRKTWLEALARANLAHAGEVGAEGALLLPDAALDGPQPPVGAYLCRALRLGGREPTDPDYLAGAAVPCRITLEAGTPEHLRLAVLDGAQRPAGRLWPDTPARMVFLGSMEVGDETRGPRYGIDPDRDMLGLFERIGDRRWRLAMPRPHWQSLLEVIEVVPVPGPGPAPN